MRQVLIRARFLILVILLLSPVSIALSANSPTSEEFTLKNGMQVILIPNKKVPAVVHMLWYKVGSVDEPAGKSGLAHFLEHLMFKETNQLSTDEFSRLLAYFGADDNAFTSRDVTVYFQQIAKEHLELAMMLEAERMTNLILEEKVIETEKNIILEERNMRVDNSPRSALTEKMRTAIYLNHPYGKPVIGTRKEIKEISLNDLKEFYHQHYRPENAILVVSGDINPSELKILAEKHYGSIKPSETKKGKPRKIPATLPHSSPREVFLEDHRVTENEWLRYYLAPSAVFGETDFAIPLSILSQILGGGETSRIYQSLVINQAIATQAATYYDETSLGETNFTFYVMPKKGVTFEEIEHAIKKEIDLLINEGVSEQELKLAQNLLKAETIYAKDGLKNIAMIYGQALAIGLDSKYVENWADKVSNVSKEDIIKAAKHVFKPEKSVTGELSKKKYDI